MASNPFAPSYLIVIMLDVPRSTQLPDSLREGEGGTRKISDTHHFKFQAPRPQRDRTSNGTLPTSILLLFLSLTQSGHAVGSDVERSIQ